MQIRTVLLTLLTIVVAAPATASPVTWFASGDLTLATRHNQRGVLREGSWALQPDVYLTAGSERVTVGPGFLRNVDLTIGLWGDADLTGLDWGELNPWIQIGAAAGPVDAALGFTSYYYMGALPPPVERRSADNTGELYWSFTGGPERFRATLAGWTDVDRVRGSYLETGISTQVPLSPFPWPGAADPLFTTIEMGLKAGWNAGQKIQPGDNANFSGDGLTHIEMSVSTNILFGGNLFVQPEVRVQVNGDRFTGVEGNGTDSGGDIIGWFVVSVSPVKLFGSRSR